MTQLLLHLFGDYILQSDWMANNKTKRWWPAVVHSLTYSLPFLFIGSQRAVFVIFFTHLLIDRFRLARWVVWVKNVYGAPFPEWPCHDEDRLSWANCQATGYPSTSQPWMATWLLIIADNTIHLAINAVCLRFL
jgi:hypothetical protein